MLKTFNTQHSLNKPECPYDNAVAKTTYKILKTQLINRRKFESLEILERELLFLIN